MGNKKRKSVIITEELMIKIISRVPVKDLMRFICVSKAWYSLIHTDTYFHGLQSECTASLDPRFVFIEKLVNPASRSQSCLHYLIDLDSIEDETINLRGIHNPFQDRDAYVLASCQGLLVLQQQFTPVSNPTTGKHLIVPANPAGDAKVAFCGFGYDRAHDCYKLITEIQRSFELTFELMVYDINHDMWCHYQWKERLPYSRSQCFGMKCVDGVQYWCLDEAQITPAREIVKVIRFDLATEEFHEVEIPDLAEVKYYPNMIVLDGRLCLVIKGLVDDIHEVWMIDMECDSNSSKAYSWRWTKILSLSNPKAILPPPYDVMEYLLMIPICFSSCRTRILFDVGQTTLLWYDIVNDQFRKLNGGPVNNVYCRVMSYIPSLVGIDMF